MDEARTTHLNHTYMIETELYWLRKVVQDKNTKIEYLERSVTKIM